jgi:alpha-glucosidase
LLDQYPDTTMVGEIGDDDGMARVAEYTQGGDKLHMAYCFDFLGEAHSAPYLHGVLSRFSEVVGDGWPCWALSNHDCTRMVTRWGGSHPDARLLRLAAAFQMSLRGSVCLYQGEELGLPEAELALEDLQDPYGITMWPRYKGRDGCRTPMPWVAGAAHAGFSDAASTWLPLAPTHAALAVDQQRDQVDSLLSYYTQLLHWRRQQTALRIGSMTLLPVSGSILAFEREAEGQRVLCVFNFSELPTPWVLPARWAKAHALDGSGLVGAQIEAEQVLLQPWGGLFLQAD